MDDFPARGNKFSGIHVTLQAMRRAQAILVIVMLLTAPVALLAGSTGADMPDCGEMCCLPHHGLHGAASHHLAAQDHAHQDGSCEHGAAEQPVNCSMKCGQAAADDGFLSPLAPTKPSNFASISRFNSPKFSGLLATTQNIMAGFLKTPFQPPRA
jgi:hypothetical protein